VNGFCRANNIDQDSKDPRRFTIAAALGTVMSRVFRCSSSALERCPMFVSKGTWKKFVPNKTKRIPHYGHLFTAHMYYTLTRCSECHSTIWGIAPQGYKCQSKLQRFTLEPTNELYYTPGQPCLTGTSECILDHNMGSFCIYKQQRRISILCYGEWHFS